jgi:hypothetical protein
MTRARQASLGLAFTVFGLALLALEPRPVRIEAQGPEFQILGAGPSGKVFGISPVMMSSCSTTSCSFGMAVMTYTSMPVGAPAAICTMSAPTMDF